MSVCAVCGSADFGDPHNGLFFCLECGTQSQDVREEVSQLEEGSRFTRRLKKKKKDKSKEAESSSESASSDRHALETFQRIIKRQCDALVDLGFNPSVKEAARLIWFTYLRHYGYAFRDWATGQGEDRRSGSQTIGCNSFQQKTPSRHTSSSRTPTTTDDSITELDKVSVPIGRSKGKGRKRPFVEVNNASNDAKRTKLTSVDSVGYDTFPDDKFLFEVVTQPENERQDKEAVRKGESVREIDTRESVRMMEEISSWEELDELERSMDCRQLLQFRQAYLSSRGPKPKFVAKDEPWAGQPRVFKLHMTVSVLYLALLYSEQPVLPVDIVRWVRLERIPLNTLLEESSRVENKTDSVRVFFATTLVTTAGVIEQTLRLYHHLPLPPVPSPDPHTISHIIIDRLQLTECFKRLVDRALDTVYMPVGFTHRNRTDSECAAVIAIMLRILYGLDDHTEMTVTDSSSSSSSEENKRDSESELDSLTTANSLPVWVDWVQLYLTSLSKSPGEEEIPFDQLELSKMKDSQSYFQFCKDTVFTKCRPVPARAKSYRELDPEFGKKIAGIFASVSHSLSHKPASDSQPLAGHRSPLPLPPTSSSLTPPAFPRLVHLSHFVQWSKAPCKVYRPLPTSHRYRQEFDESQLSHAMKFVLSVICRLIDVPLQSLYTVLLAVEKAFTKGMAAMLRNINQDFLSK